MICVIKYSICVFLLAPLGRGTSHQLLETAANALCVILSQLECDVLDRVVGIEQHFREAADALLGDILVNREADDLLEPYLQQPAGERDLFQDIIDRKLFVEVLPDVLERGKHFFVIRRIGRGGYPVYDLFGLEYNVVAVS